jgi:hypothetical protein
LDTLGRLGLRQGSECILGDHPDVNASFERFGDQHLDVRILCPQSLDGEFSDRAIARQQRVDRLDTLDNVAA